jgi:hypothetical protein
MKLGLGSIISTIMMGRKRNFEDLRSLSNTKKASSQSRLTAAFEMLFPDGIRPADLSGGPVEPQPGTQLPLF